MDPQARLLEAASWAGWPLDKSQMEALQRFGGWLADEAAPAGGIGPNESARIVSRHLADSLLFAGGWPGPMPPSSMVDLGSGVGLPGIPLAILWPHTEVVLVDRSEKRTSLAKRAIRVLGLSTVRAEQRDAGRAGGLGAPLVVARAAGPIEEVRRWARSLAPGAERLVVGGSHDAPPPEAGLDETILEVPRGVLDRPVWLRIMAPP